MSLYSDIFSSLGPSRHQEGMILAASQRTTIRLETTFVRSMPLWLEGALQKCWPFMRQLVSLKWRFQLTRLTQMLAGSLIASARMLWQTLAVAERPPNTILPPVMRPVRMNSLSGDSEHPEELLYSGHIDSGLEVLESVLKQVNLRIPGTGMRLLPEVLLGRLKLRIRGLGWRERGGEEYERKDLIRIDRHAPRQPPDSRLSMSREERRCSQPDCCWRSKPGNQHVSRVLLLSRRPTVLLPG